MQQGNISFQSDFFPKNHEIGSLAVRLWEKTKYNETHGRVVRVGKPAFNLQKSSPVRGGGHSL